MVLLFGRTAQCPFNAYCKHIEAKSPLREGEKVIVLEMAPESECQNRMWVQVEWENRRIAVPLVQLQPLNTDDSTIEAVDDWHYWVESGYRKQHYFRFIQFPFKQF